MSNGKVVDAQGASEKVTPTEIPITAQVDCAGGLWGRSTHIIINPVSQRVTHLVVKEKKAPHIERLVPFGGIAETADGLIRLRCSRDELVETRAFIEAEYIRESVPAYERVGDWYLPVTRRRIPHGELAVRRSARVYARDGCMGRVGGFLVSATDGHITHLVLCKGPPWGQKKVSIPASQIDRIGEDAIHLKLDKHGVKALLTTLVRWR